MTIYWDGSAPKKQNGHRISFDPAPLPLFWPRYRCPLCGWLDLQLTSDRRNLHCVACQVIMPAEWLKEAA